MPTYDYACTACRHRFEVVHGVHGTGPDTCPSCGSGPVRKAFAPPTVLFKGSGWAKMDRRSSPSTTRTSTDGDDKGTKDDKGPKDDRGTKDDKGTKEDRGTRPARETTEAAPAAASASDKPAPAASSD